MKSYNEFRNEIAPRVANLCSRKGLHMSVQLLRDGTTASDEASKILIDETNYLYGHAGADCLIGDYLLLVNISKKRAGYRCRFALDLLFKLFCVGEWEMVDDAIIGDLQQAESMDRSVIENIRDYGQVKDKLLLCMRHSETCKIADRDMMCRLYGDMAMTLYAIVKEYGADKRMIAPVPRVITEAWRMSEEKIFTSAMANTERLMQPRISPNLPIIRNGGDFLSCLKQMQSPSQALVTTEPSPDGAIAMFYPGVQEYLAEIMQGDYFAVFTARDECHIHRVDNIPAEKLQAMLDDVNRRYSETMLTKYVYRYDAKRKELKKAL
ncbi:MAG: hypothetical protein IKN81_03445 [Oscillospiraceae bacterium]|nr:hypothetical protein [Oscillospiraceae bacterium]